MNPGLFWAFFTLALAALCLAVSIVDMRTFRIPNALNATIAVVGALAVATLGLDWAASALGAALGYATLFAFSQFYLKVRKIDGLGLGDAKLFAALGIWTGWTALPFVLLIAAGLALVGVFVARISGRATILRTTPVPFGPFLSLGALTVWIGQRLGWLPFP